MPRKYTHKISAQKRRTIRRTNHKAARKLEEKVKRRYERNGYTVTRDGHNGYDYRVRKNGQTKYVEVKSNNSALKPAQKKAQKKHGSRYIVERHDN